MNIRWLSAGMSGLVSTLSFFCHANTGESGFRIELESAYLHNSNLAIDALDRSSELSDNAIQLRAALQGEWVLSPTLVISGGYDVNSENYDEMDEFDTLTHLGHLGMRYQIGQFNFGASYHYADVLLDGEDFLTLRQPSLSVGAMFNSHWYGRIALTEQTKQFATLPERNADNDSLSADAYYFYTTDNFFALGVTAEQERARNDRFSYTGWGTGFSWTHNLHWMQRSLQLRFSWKHEQRDFTRQTSLQEVPDEGTLGSLFGDSTVTTVSHSSKRKDRRDSLGLEMELALMPMLSLGAGIEYNDNRSNLESADYDAVITSLSLRLAL